MWTPHYGLTGPMDADVQAVLERYPPDCRAASGVALGSAGGFSGARIWKLQAARGTLALRCWPQEHPSPERLAWIHHVAAHALANGFTLLAQPVRTTDGATFVYRAGRLWELAPWLGGVADYHARPSRERLSNAMQALARFHRAVESFPFIELQRGPSPGIVERRARLARLLVGGLEELSAALTSRPVAPEVADACRRFVSLFPRAAALVGPLVEDATRLDVALQPCLGDVWSDHVLFVGDEVTGIVDLGAMRVDSVAADIARLLGSLAASDAAARDLGAAAYEIVRPLDADERCLVIVIERANIALSPALWLRWLLVDGRTFDDPAAVTKRLLAAVARLERLVSEPRGGTTLILNSG
ncbi:MAG: hypothetical protein DCC68_12970 [Planctomycetota bacterium]|nr:MAG: hypothetical protein DCC68_12970 [Planctomycetota bacterium]